MPVLSLAVRATRPSTHSPAPGGAIQRTRTGKEALIAAVRPGYRGWWGCPSLFLRRDCRCLAVLPRFFFSLLGQCPLFAYSLPSDRFLTRIAYRGGTLHRLATEHATVRFFCHRHYPRFPCGRATPARLKDPRSGPARRAGTYSTGWPAQTKYRGDTRPLTVKKQGRAKAGQ
jgi:hypothetical protein